VGGERASAAERAARLQVIFDPLIQHVEDDSRVIIARAFYLKFH
jgi:hypothetical protein